MTSDVLFDAPFDQPLLTAAGCPSSGNGALVYLQQLGSALESCQSWGISASTQDWQRHVRQLSKSISAHPSSPSSSPTAAELVNQPWGTLHECIAARRSATNSAALQLDVVFVYLILEAAAGHRPLTSTALEGLKKCYSAQKKSGKLKPDWARLGTSNIIDKPALTELVKDLTYGVARQFGMTVLSYLDRPMPTLAGISGPFASPDLAGASLDPQALASSAEAPTLESSTEERDPTVPAAAASLDQPQKFERGDSVLEWHLSRVQNARRDDCLGLESWTSLSVDQTCRIAARLPALMSDAGSPWQRAAVLATATLLTSTPPHVLLHAPLNQNGDLNIDIENQRFTWPIEVLRGATNAGTTLTPETLICIPFPAGFGQALTAMSQAVEREALQYFADAFQVSENSGAWSALIRQTYDMLKELSDPTFQAFPGRWSNSVSRVYMEVSSSDLLAATCSLDLSLTPQAALYYFHPSDEDIRTTVEKAYARLGLGTTAFVSKSSAERGIPPDQALTAGFAAIYERTHQLRTAVADKRADIQTRIQQLNELTRLVAALTVFLIGGRGSRVGEMTCGALYCSADSLWIEDKKVAHENSSRILPKPSYLSDQLHLLHVAKQSVADRLAVDLHRNRADRWKELAAGQLRFEAHAFETWEFQRDRVTRAEVTATDVERVSQKYFGARKNFMRHVLVTQWACDGEDHNLLRLITGHATAGLAVPAAGATYTPASAVAAAGCVLEKLLQKWLPTRENTKSIKSDYRFVSLPGRTILKAVGSARSHIEQWDAPTFTRWHLAANRIMDRIRHLLLNGHGPDTTYPNLWLHLVCFDAIHEPLDIESIFNDIDASFELGRLGWVIKITRQGSPHLIVTPAQLPTAVVLGSASPHESREHQPYEQVVQSVRAWLCKSMPDCWVTKANSELALLAAAALWADWHLPAAVQACYAPESHAPVLDTHSNQEYMGVALDPRQVGKQPTQRPRNRAGDAFDQLCQTLNALGSNQHKLGEQKRRAQLFERWLSIAKFPDAGELAALLAQVVKVNIVRIRASKKSAIAFSSSATYFASLRPHLESLKHIDVAEFDAFEWREFCRDLVAFSTNPERRKTTAVDAAHWLLSCVRELGYPLPSTDELANPERFPRSTIPIAIAAISPRQRDAAVSLLCARNESPLAADRLKLAFTLLNTLPLRRGELAALHCCDLMDDGTLCVTTHGYAHLKSHAARHRLRLEPEQLLEMQSLVQQVREHNCRGQVDPLIFGSRRTNDGVVATDSDWIGAQITQAVQAVTSNSNFRIHSFRACSVSQRLLPGWENALVSICGGDLGPTESCKMFDYNQQRAWAVDRTRLEAGHASVSTTLSYYFHAWAPTRFISIFSRLSTLKPTDFLLTRLGVSRAAWIKARARNENLRSDPWAYLLSKTPKKVTSPSDPCTVSPVQQFLWTTSAANAAVLTTPAANVGLDATSPTTVSTETTIKDVTYVGLRVLGMPQLRALNQLSISQRNADQNLEPRVALSTLAPSALRGRIKGAIDGRAFEADVRLLLSPAARELCTVLSQMPTDGLRLLLKLLIPDHAVLQWDTELLNIAPWLENSRICLEVVSDVKRVDLQINLRLAGSAAVFIGSPAHDIGLLPRIFVQPRDPTARSTVAKARWTTVVRVLCHSLLLLSESAA